MKKLNLASKAQREPIEKVCIIVPTYNESKNILTLLNLLKKYDRAQKAKNRFSIQILVVDDSSPDGTADLVRSYQKKNKNVHLLVRKDKDGLGKAYIAGMKHVLTSMSVDAICQMDADLSHNPKDVFRLLTKLNEGYDLVIGSRYIKGGKIPSDWGLDRKIKSNIARTVMRVGLRLGNVRDCSGGFKAIRTSMLRKIDLDSLAVKGYAFQAVIIESIVYERGSVVEIPIVFTDRKKGKSKMGAREFVEGWFIIARIRWKRLFSKRNKNHSPHTHTYKQSLSISNVPTHEISQKISK